MLVTVYEEDFEAEVEIDEFIHGDAIFTVVKCKPPVHRTRIERAVAREIESRWVDSAPEPDEDPPLWI